MLDLEANHLAGAQAAAIAETEHHPDLEGPGHRQQPFGLVRAHDERQLLRLLEVIDLGGEIVPPERDTKQEPHPGHDAVAIADAQPALDQVQLEAAYSVGGGGVGRALEIGGEPLAAVDVAPL